MSVAGPKSDKGASKKNKKSWRKNTDIQAVEEFLDDQRLEERLGGAFDDRPDADLFVVDKESAAAAEPAAAALALAPTSSARAARKKRFAEKPMSCYRNLELKGGVKDPKKGRNRRRTDEERRNPTLVKKEQALRQAGVVKAKVALAGKHRSAEAARKAAGTLERSTRRRTEFDFDLWDKTAEVEGEKEVASNGWLDEQTKSHTLKNTRRLRRRAPADFGAKTSDLPAVVVPHGGTSYNPSLADHQDLLFRAAMVEVDKEREEHRINYHTVAMFPDRSEAPTKQTWLAEMGEGIGGEGEKSDEEKDDDDEEEMVEEDKGNKAKTRKQRRKAREAQMAEKRRRQAARERLRGQDVFRLRSMGRQLRAGEAAATANAARRVAARAAKERLEPARLAAARFEEPELDLKLSDELAGSLSGLRPEGSLLEDRFKSLQRRNVIETRVKHKIVRNKRNRKKAEKRSYKMGFEWEKK